MEAEDALARELALRSGVYQSRAALLGQASAGLPHMIQLRDHLGKHIESGAGTADDKAQFRQLCLEIASLEKTIGHYR